MSRLISTPLEIVCNYPSMLHERNDGDLLDMIRSTIGIFAAALIVPYLSLEVGDHFQSQISNADNSAIPWRRARLSYRIAQFSPFLWTTASEHQDQTDLILSDHFFSQVLRGDQDAIVPQNHLDFLSDRPDTVTWNAIRGQTLLQYGQFTDALSLATQKSNTGFGNLQSIAAFFVGDLERLQEGCALWAECPKGWNHLLPFDSTVDESAIEAMDWTELPEANQPIFLEWVLSQTERRLSTEWFARTSEEMKPYATDNRWRCANLALATTLKDPLAIEAVTREFWGEKGSEWWFSYGNMLQSVPCHPKRFEDALTIANDADKTILLLLKATAHTALFDITNAQMVLKEIDVDSADVTDDQRILYYHLRVLTRELAGSTSGMEKYIELGAPLNKALFNIHLGKSKLYQQAKTTAIQSLSALNGYPIPPKMQQEYTDMLMLSKRLNGSASKIQIGQHALEYDFMDNDATFREWLIAYHSELLDTPTSTPMTIPLLRFWRGEDKHSDQLIQTHLEQSIQPYSVILSTHQRFLEASLRGEKALTKTTWKQFSKTRAWLDEVPFPQMLGTHPEWFTAPWPQ